ncbi:MAG: hypothetical protein ACI957_002590 [Verrucomicrobiales bacterium]|jgi:hypothetical protein
MKLTPTIRLLFKMTAALGLALPVAQAQDVGDIELIAYWDFENTAEDSWGGFEGYLGGDAKYTDGEKFGFALDTSALEGSFFRIQATDELEEGNPVSPEFFDAYHATASARDQVTYTFWQRNTDELRDQVAYWTVSEESGGEQRGAQSHTPWSNDNIYFDTAGCCDATQRLTDVSGVEDWMAWNHFAFVKDGEHKEIWVNGELLLEGDGYAPLPEDMIAHYIGNGVEETRDQPGLIDEFGIIAGAASEDQIKELAGGATVIDIFDPSDPNFAIGKAVNFGQVPAVSGAQELKFSFKNTGDTMALNISSVQIVSGDMDNFTLVSSPTTVDAETKGEVVLTFDSKSEFRQFEAVLEFKTDDPDADDQTVLVPVRAKVLNPVGPKAHLPLDETTGDVASDTTGFDRHGAYSGATLGQPGLTADTGTAVSFSEGSNVVIPSSAFGPLPSFSVSLWANAVSNGDAGAADFRTLVAKGEANPAFGLLEAGGELLWFREEGVAFSTNSTPITAGTNYHLVMRLDGESGMGSIFVDGVEVITEAVEAVGDDSGNFYIGAFGGALGFAGTIDDVQIYDLAITNDQVAFLMNNPSKELRPDGPIDSDGDGLSDEDEIGTHNTDPFVADSDGDNLSDGQEIALGTDPNNEDTDGDRFKDGLEIERGTDPLVVDERGGGQVTIEILGTGVEALLGGDLTDPENDGLDEAGAAMDPSWNWVNITGNIEDDFGDPEQSFNIFDNQVGGGGAKWCCDDPSPDNPYWVSVEFAEAVSLTHFTITNGNDSPDRDPTNWQIQGSNDGETFETIFAEDAESIWTEERNEVALVTLASPSAPYKHIRYIVFDTPGALHQLNEIEYFGNVATSLLVNGSFEEPVLDNINTNNLGTVPTGWSQTGDDATWNLIRNDGSAYGSGVDSAADGSQIIDLNGLFEMFQNFTLAADSNVTFGASFANREGHDGSDPSTVGIYDAAGTNLLSPVVSVDTSAEPIPSEVWLSGEASVTLPAGDYQLRIALNNFNNVDAVFATATPPGGSTLGNGLIAYYPLDGDFDDNVGDAHGAEQGTAPIEFAAGAFGQGADLDGVDQFIITPVEVEDRFDFSDDTGFSVSAWFRVDAFDKSWQALVTKGEGSNWRIHRQGDTNNFGPVAGAGDFVGNPVDVNDGGLHHVVITNIPGLSTNFYLDGVLNESRDAGIPEGNEWPMMIGENANGGGNGRTWNGLIDDVAVWNRGLTDEEVAQIFNGPSVGDQIAGGGGGGPALIAHFPLDADGNSADGGFSASVTTDVTFDGTGANANTGTSAVFNGSSSLIQHDWTADLNPESFTLALWAKSDGGAGAWNSPVTSRHDLNAEGEASQGYLIYDNEPAGAWTFWSGNGTVDGNWQLLDGPAVTVGEWEHVAISYDNATETKRLYINGVLAVEANDSIAPNDTTPFNIGAGEDTGTGFHFVGEIDDIGLWNAELTVEQIQAAMNNGVQAALSGGDGGGSVDVPNIGTVIAGPDSVGLAFTGLAGKTYDIEYSTDLVTWSVVMSDLSGDVSFEDTDAARLGLASGYYRGVQK